MFSSQSGISLWCIHSSQTLEQMASTGYIKSGQQYAEKFIFTLFSQESMIIQCSSWVFLFFFFFFSSMTDKTLFSFQQILH